MSPCRKQCLLQRRLFLLVSMAEALICEYKCKCSEGILTTTPHPFKKTIVIACQKYLSFALAYNSKQRFLLKEQALSSHFKEVGFTHNNHTTITLVYTSCLEC